MLQRQSEVPAADACRALEASIQTHWPRYGSVKVEYSLVEVAELKTVISRIAPRRLHQASSVLTNILKSGSTPYLPLVYSNKDGQDAVAFGPLVERHKAELLLIDGVHRCLAALGRGISVVHAAVIEADVIPPPPGRILSLLDADILNTDAERLPPFNGKNSAEFRPSFRFTSEAEAALLRGAGGDAGLFVRY